MLHDVCENCGSEEMGGEQLQEWGVCSWTCAHQLLDNADRRRLIRVVDQLLEDATRLLWWGDEEVAYARFDSAFQIAGVIWPINILNIDRSLWRWEDFYNAVREATTSCCASRSNRVVGE